MSSTGESQDIVGVNSNTQSATDNEIVNVIPKDKTLISDNKSSGQSRKRWSTVWEHYTRIGEDDKSKMRAECKYCGNSISCASSQGTSSLHNHLDRCKKYSYKIADKKQRTISFQQVSSSSSCSSWKFEQELSRKALAKMFIIDELPFKEVESNGFRSFMNIVQPKFIMPSRITLRRDIYDIYLAERNNLKQYFSKHSLRVSLTTDTWTSCQNLSYMCLTTHFVDENWKLQKKILNFCPLPNHSGEVIGKAVEKCLIGWDISKVFCITVDNASSNDVGIQYLKRRFQSWHSLLLNGEFLHMRCCAHILNLIVREGLKDLADSIYRIRTAVRYVRSSPARLQRFKSCIEQEKIESKTIVCLDVETRWNSTYLMLQSALKFQKAFDLLEIQDKKFWDELFKMKGVPTSEDWEYARVILPFLKLFYDATMRISGSIYVTSNCYMKEIYGIGLVISQHCQSNDRSLKVMAEKMKQKHDKYWGNINNINIMLFISVILDPRHKLEYVYWVIRNVYDAEKASGLQAKVFSILTSMFQEYNDITAAKSTKITDLKTFPQSSNEMSTKAVKADLLSSIYMKQTGQQNLQMKSELEKYLEESCEPYSDDDEFDILNWWKGNHSRYPILSLMARDVLAIPVSTVASESTFSTGGRILDVFRSSLTPRMVEALICTQDWLKSSTSSLPIEENFEELDKIESEMISESMEPTHITLDVDD